jgi:mono/diheme cytochrome c family protein
MLPDLARVPRRVSVVVTSLLLVIAVAGCGLKHATGSLVEGKVLFASKCGSCHTLAHANTSGTTGPNLDDAFRQDMADGINRTAIEGLVGYWIGNPNTQGVMPAHIVSGQDASDIAAYVAVAAKAGTDTGELARAGGVTGTTAADGLTVFNGVGGCASCHTLAAAGSHGVAGPNLDEHLKTDCASARSVSIRGATLEKCIYTAITNPYAYLPAGYSAGVMPSNFAKSLTKTEIEALVNFLSTAAK